MLKKLFFMLFLFLNLVTAGENYRSSDFQLSGAVVRCEEMEYNYNPGLGKYMMTSRRTIELENGLVRKIDFANNYFLYVQGSTIYSYDEQNRLVALEKNISGDEEKSTFEYSAGRLSGKVENGQVFTTYEYDGKGRLIRETSREDNAVSGMVEYSDYTSADSYHLRSLRYNSGEIEEEIIEEFRGGLKMKSDFRGQHYKEVTTYEYDRFGHIIAQNSQNNGPHKNMYELDEQGNLLKADVTEFDFEVTDSLIHYFTFARVTYADGRVTGSTDLDADFVRRFEPGSGSYEVSLEPIGGSDQLAEALDAINNFSAPDFFALKVGTEEFKIITSGEEYITGQVIGTRSTNSLDLFIYDPGTGLSAVTQNFFDPATPAETWLDMITLQSPTGIFWIVNEAEEVYLVENGQWRDMSVFTLRAAEQPNDLIVQENGSDRYFIRDFYSKAYHIFFPLESLE